MGIMAFDPSAAATKETLFAGRGKLLAVEVINNITTDVFLQLFDGLAADVTVGTTQPNQSLLVPGGAGASNRGAREAIYPKPPEFAAGLVYAVTTTPTGSTAPATAAQINFQYEVG